MSWKVTKRKHGRRGLTPADRPTEWTVAAAMLVTAFLSWATDHDTATFVAVIAACLPALTTAVVTWWESRG
jgi:hypothetical protein